MSAADWMTKNLKQFSTWQVLPVIKHWNKLSRFTVTMTRVVHGTTLTRTLKLEDES